MQRLKPLFSSHIIVDYIVTAIMILIVIAYMVYMVYLPKVGFMII
jgi:hypothetical protein